MAERRPLVLINGQLTELPTGDTVPGVGGSGDADYTVVTAGQTLDDDAPLLAQITTAQTFTVPASPEVGDEYVVKNASVSTALASIDPGAGRQIVYGNGQSLPVADPLTIAAGEQAVLIVRTATSFELQTPGAVGPEGPAGVGFNYVQAAEPVGAIDGETWLDTDLDPLDRANHTGAQAIATVTGLQTALNAKEVSGAAAAAIAAHELAGDPHSQYLTPAEGDAAYAPLSHTHAASQISDSTTAGRALLTAVDAPAQRTLLNVADGATANAADAALRDRATHTGAQATSTITGLDTALNDRVRGTVRLTVGPTAPSDPNLYDIWVDTN